MNIPGSSCEKIPAHPGVDPICQIVLPARAYGSDKARKMTNTPFPVYLRITDGHSVYRIASEISFTEVQHIGQRYVAHHIVAHTWPERLRIADMLANADGAWAVITEAEFDLWLGRTGSR